ncbi:MAG: hypothetical protein Q4D07_01295 [Selenomonadaceae bacterium]|nr:hypothetical protein [Selenomonadaceae bacterium]
MLFDNGAACRYWLDRLAEQEGADRLLGENSSTVVDMARIYETGLGPVDFGAEIQLTGESGIDLSVQYALSDFDRANPLSHPLVIPAGDFLLDYNRQLTEKGFAHLIADRYAYLEADTSKGEAGAVAMFLNLSGTAAREMLPFILQEQRQSERLTAVQDILQRVNPELPPWYFGFMHSREELPLRLSFYVREEAGLSGMLSALRRLGIEPGEGAEQLAAVDELGLFTYMLDVDVMADGSLGDTWGVELTPRAVLPVQQQKMLGGDSFARFTELLVRWGMADDRSTVLPRCFWSCDYRDGSSGRAYVMYSYLSHLKLRWQTGKLYPAKVYIQLRNIPKQTTINEYLYG